MNQPIDNSAELNNVYIEDHMEYYDDIYKELAENTFCITHYYNLMDQDIYVERVSGNIDPRRAAIYCQFWAEKWHTKNPNDGIVVSTFGIAAMLIRFYGFRYVNGGVADCQTIDMHTDRENACGPDVGLLLNDPTLVREGLKEAIYHYIDCGLGEGEEEE